MVSTMLVPGDVAPDFEAPVSGGGMEEGSTVKLSALHGTAVILYFYPKDDTPGCTAQACSIRDHYGTLLKGGAKIFGVSVDSLDSHKKFIEKYGLPFPLLSDEKKEIVQSYGVWVEKSMYGKTFMGTERSTFVIGKDGKIRSVFRKVKPEEHTQTVLEDLSRFEP